MLRVDYKKWYCRPVKLKKTSCCPVEIKKVPCHPVELKEVPCHMSLSGGSRGGCPGGQDPSFWGTPKFYKEGKNIARMHAKNATF